MSIPVRPAVHASPEYPFSPVEATVKLDQNEASEDFPHELKALALERMKAVPWNRYTDLQSEALCQSIAIHEGWQQAGTVVATGSNVLISLLIQLSALNRRVLTVRPNFALYGLDARLLECALTEIDLRPDFSTDVAAIIAALSDDAPVGPAPRGVIYISQPHAPTGTVVPAEELEWLAQACKGWLLVIDEAYQQFSGESSLNLARQYAHVVVLRTFSKAWGLAGLRLGYALASEDVARQLRKLVPPFAISALQTVVAQVALENPGYMRERVAVTVEERERMTRALSQHPHWQVFPSRANFLLIRTPDAAQAHADLLSHGVLVRRQDSYFGLQGCIRVTVGTPVENDAFLAAAGLGP